LSPYSSDRTNGSTSAPLLRNLKWFLLYLGVGVGYAFFVPFPLSLLALVGTILIIDIIKARRILKKAGIEGGFTDIVRSLSTNRQSPHLAKSESSHISIKYYCMSCGRENKKVKCDYCGSKMRRVGT
jgi:hypothetical protein